MANHLMLLNSIDANLVTLKARNHALNAAMKILVMNAMLIIISIVKRKDAQHAQHHVKHASMNLLNALHAKMVMD